MTTLEEMAKEYGIDIAQPILRSMFSASRGAYAKELSHAFLSGAKAGLGMAVHALKDDFYNMIRGNVCGVAPDGRTIVPRQAVEVITTIMGCAERIRDLIPKDGK